MKQRKYVNAMLLFIQLQTCCVYPAPPPPAPPATPPSSSPLLPALLAQSQTQDVRESCIFGKHILLSLFLLSSSDSTPLTKEKKHHAVPRCQPSCGNTQLSGRTEDSSLDSSLRECWDGDARRLPSSHHTQQLHRMTNDCEGQGGATQHQRPESCQKMRRGDEEFSLQTKTPLCIVLASTRSLAGDRREETMWCRGLDRWRCCLTNTMFQTVGCDVHPADL